MSPGVEGQQGLFSCSLAEELFSICPGQLRGPGPRRRSGSEGGGGRRSGKPTVTGQRKKQARGVIVTEPLNTTYKQARTALGGGETEQVTEAREGQGGAVRARSWRGLRLPSPEGLG